MSANKPLGLDDITYVASAEGMARRVLQNLEKSNLTKGKLANAYRVNLELLGSSYVHLMGLGKLLEDLDALSRKSENLTFCQDAGSARRPYFCAYNAYLKASIPVFCCTMQRFQDIEKPA